MNRQTMLHPMLLSVLLLPLAACNVEKPLEKARDTVARQESSINQKISKKLDEAKAELETENLSLNGGSNFIVGNNSSLIGKGNDKLPKAEISPRGELFIEGSKVALTPEQEARLLAYREQLIGIVRAGIDIGGKGAGLGLTAARVALSSLLDEGVDETQIKAEAEKLKAEARQLCTRLPALLTAQQELATLVPAFQPYATLSVADIRECEKNIDAEASEAAGNPADSDPATSKEQR